MSVEKIIKDLARYDTIREKVLRLNEIDKFDNIHYGYGYITIKVNNDYFDIIDNNERGCVNCGNIRVRICNKKYVKLQVAKCNTILFYLCESCIDKKLTLCNTCLRESTECREITKRKITFWLCTNKFKKFIIPKDIRRLIINLFF
jgi:hypothetical protein